MSKFSLEAVKVKGFILEPGAIARAPGSPSVLKDPSKRALRRGGLYAKPEVWLELHPTEERCSFFLDFEGALQWALLRPL
jgi:hypothetical protein